MFILSQYKFSNEHFIKKNKILIYNKIPSILNKVKLVNQYRNNIYDVQKYLVCSFWFYLKCFEILKTI